MCTKFGNSSASRKEVMLASILQGSDQKKHFFEEWSWFKFNSLGLALGMTLKSYTDVTKGLTLKVKRFLGLIPAFVEVAEKKLVTRNPLPAPTLF